MRHPLALVASDINTSLVRYAIALQVNEVLRVNGLLLQAPPPKQKKKRGSLRLVRPEDPSQTNPSPDSLGS